MFLNLLSKVAHLWQGLIHTIWSIYKINILSDQTHAGVWVLDGDPSHTGLLKFAITEENFENILVLLVASMAHPWSIMESLNKWASYLREHIDRLKLKPEDRREYEDSCKLGCSQLSIHSSIQEGNQILLSEICSCYLRKHGDNFILYKCISCMTHSLWNWKQMLVDLKM